jgi:heptosyltransferase-1
MYTAGITSSPGSRILVVRLGAMGDIVQTLPAVASLKHSFPGSTLTWLVEPKWAPLLEDNPFVDRIAILRRGGPGQVLASCRELREESYDFAVDFQGLVKSAIVASLARAERIFGFHQSQARERPAGLFYSSKIQSNSIHVVERALDLAAAAGAANILRTFPVPPGAPEAVLPDEFVLASPLAGWRSKQWPLEYYAQLAVRLQQELGIPLVLNGPPDSADMLHGVAETLLACTGVPGLIDVTRRATAVVGVDSGPMHLAAALGKPGVAIFGPTDPARNGPYGDSMTVLRSLDAVTSYKRGSAIDPSMTLVTPDEVFAALKTQLTRRANSAGCFV